MDDNNLIYVASKNYDVRQNNMFIQHTGVVYVDKVTFSLYFRLAGHNIYPKAIGTLKDFEVVLDKIALQNALYLHQINDECYIGDKFFRKDDKGVKNSMLLVDILAELMEDLRMLYI